MFQFDPNPTFPAVVQISSPGVAEPLALDIIFKHKTKAEVLAWGERCRAATGPELATLLDEVIHGWSAQDRNGADVPYSAENLSQLLQNFALAHQDIHAGYLAAVSEAKRKNS